MTDFIKNIKKRTSDAKNEVLNNKTKYIVKPISAIFGIVSLYFSIRFLINKIIEVYNNRHNPIVSTCLIAVASLFIILSCALLYYQFYKPKNKVDSKEFSSCTNKALKKNYEDNKYLKIGQLIKIRWANRLSSIVLGLALLIIMKMGSNNKNFKDALIPALFIFFAIIVLVVLNNIISSKIEKDLEAFDKEIASNLQKVNESSKEEFTLFNQLMLERGRLEKSTYINFFKDSVSGENSGKSMLQSLVLFFASIFKNIGLAFMDLVVPSSKENTADKKINENLGIYNGLKVISLNLDDNQFIKDINKKSGLLKKDSVHNNIFKILDSLCIQESVGRVFD